MEPIITATPLRVRLWRIIITPVLYARWYGRCIRKAVK